jgi:hypothetical protein
MSENNKPQIPKLETPQTQHIRASYPIIEYLEDGYVADWLKERKDQLLELAREEKSGIDANKLVSSAVLVAGFFFHALSPLAPVGVVLGLIGYVHGCFIDANHTGSFSPFPFVRGNILDLAGTLGNAELREKVNDDIDEFEQLQHYLSPVERKEYHLLNSHFSVLTDYLTQVEPLKRFHAYRWILDCFVRYKGALPTSEQVNAHMANVTADIRVERTNLELLSQHRAYLEARKDRTIEQMNEFTPMPLEEIKFISDEQMRPTDIGSETKLNAINVPATPVEDKPTELVSFKKEIPNLPKLLASTLKLSLICGIPGCGKGIFVSNALEEVRARTTRKVTIFYIDPKNDPKETAYFSGRVDYLFRKDLMTSDPQDAFEWVQECLGTYDDFDCEGGYKLLVFDELLLTLKTLQLVKGAVHWFKTKITGYASSGDSRGIIFWGISQNAHVSGLGFDGGDRTMFVPVFIVDARNISASVGLLASKMIPSDQRLTSKQIQELCEKSPVGRAIYFGGINRWYPMPKLENYSGFDRDTRTFLPGFAPPPKGEKLAVDYDAVNSLENTFKLDANKVPDVPEVEQVENAQDEKATIFDFNKGLEALRSAVGKDWMKFGEARSSLKPLRKVTRDVDDVKLLVNFLVREREAEIKDNEFFRIIKKPD